jgi:micrococcal nuclease
MAYVNHGGNLRSAPRVAPDTVIGQVCPGDQVAVLDDQAGWYRLRVVKTMADCVPQRVGAGTEGWMSSSLVTPTADRPEGYPDLPGGLVSAIVRDVLNGHTIEVAVSGVVKRVNLIGVNAPLPPQPDQPGECFGAEAAAGLADILGLDGQFVLLETDETQGELDRQGQLLSYMWLPDGRMVNYEMIARGYAFSESFNLPYAYQEVFAQVGGEAREDQRGLWSPETCNGERKELPQHPGTEEDPVSPAPTAGTLPGTAEPTPQPQEEAGQPEEDAEGMPPEPTLPPPPAPMPPPQTPQREVDRNGDGEVTCEDFTTCDEAFDALDAGYTHLDYDHDGIPCKELCGN